MAKKFPCKKCGAVVFARFPTPGARARCGHCGAEDTVPPDAVEIDDIQALRQATAAKEVTPPAELLVLKPEFGELPEIGGWLVLPSIGLVFGALLWAVAIVGLFGAFALGGDVWFRIFTSLELVVYMGLLAFTIYAAVRFFSKKKDAPKRMIQLIAANAVIVVVFFIISLGVDDVSYRMEALKGLVQGIFGAAVWIPYFMVSKRVKATFVR